MSTTDSGGSRTGGFVFCCDQAIANKRRGARKGFIFSLDLAIALITVLLMLNLALLHFNEEKESLLAGAKKSELQKNALLLADSLVKNNNAENPLLGAAFFDNEKHRVLSNVVQKELLREAQADSFGGWHAQALSLKTKNGAEETFFAEEKQAGKDCVAVERFVIAGTEKALLRVAACEE
ncbi:MAG: hypothetical protein NTW59_01050 [Candidatus Diapherotrites archaeon]|nr:hypothetical protein [Candidatus Diapherotrites archaeon]